MWRPLGLLMFKALKAISSTGFGLEDHLLIISAYRVISTLCGFGVAIILHSLALSVSRSQIIAAGVALAFVLSNGVLNYTQTGNAYITGLFFLTAGVWGLKRAAGRPAVAPGAELPLAALLALAVLFWFPYVLVLPAAFLIPAVFAEGGPPRAKQLWLTLRLAAVCAVLIAVVYGVAAAALHLGSAADAGAWIANGKHGVERYRDNGLRLIFAVPRAFIEMGDGGKLVKRYLFGDPYGSTTALDVILKVALPLVVFYSTVGLAVLASLRSLESRKTLLLLAAAAIPVFFFAIFIFEPGSIERYFPIYPFAVLFVSASLAQAAFGGLHRIAAAILFGAIVLASGLAMSPSRSHQRQQETAQRIQAVRNQLGSGFFTIVDHHDDLMSLGKTYPFHPLNRPSPVPMYTVFEFGNVRMLTWQPDFARKVHAAWSGNGNVWVSKRLVADHPLPSWGWVEGDDPRITWSVATGFFRGLDYEGGSGGDDGFLLLKHSEGNQRKLNELLAR